VEAALVVIQVQLALLVLRIQAVEAEVGQV
jgi:hypothetical protein